MADGSERPIEEVEVGDFVLGSQGQANLVLGLKRPALGARLLYAFNDGDHFVTAEHPFLTTDGWKSIDPLRTAEEVPNVDAGRLQLADRLLVAGSRPRAGVCTDVLTATALEQVLLTSIRSRRDDPATPLYNLTVDGDNTYLANGFVVHNY